MKEYLCDCEICLNLELSWWKKLVASVGEIGDDFLEECMVDEDDDRESRFYEYVSTPSYMSLLSCNASDLVYSAPVEKKSEATEKLQDRYGHVILPGELYFEVRYLQKSRSRHPSKKKSNVLGHTVYITPGEIFEIFVEFADDLTMGSDSY